MKKLALQIVSDEVLFEQELSGAYRRYFYVLLRQARNLLTVHGLSKLAMFVFGGSALIPVFSLKLPSVEFLIFSALAFLVHRATKSVAALFGGPLFDYTGSPSNIWIKPITSWGEGISVPAGIIPGPASKEIQGYEYRDLNEHLKREEFVDVRKHVKSLMQSNGKLTYRDLFSVLVYTEGKTAWLNQQVREQEAQRAKQELVLARQELAGQPPEVNELSSLDNKDDGNTLTDHELRKGWRKVIVETKRDAPDE